MTNIGLLPATTTNQFSTSTPLSGRVLYQQASTGERPYTQVAIQFADGTAEHKNSLSNQFIEAAGQEGIAKLSATPEGQYALQIVYDHASSGGQKLMREVHEGQGNTAVDYTHKNENMCTADAFHKEGATPEEQHLNNLMKQYGDHVSGEIPLPPSESIRLRNEIDRVSQLVNPGQHNLWGDYSPQEKQYLAEQALQNRQAINNLGMWVGGPVFSALPALGRVLDAPEPVVEGLGQINAEMAGGKAFGRQGRGIQPVDTPIYSGPVKTYVLDAKSVKIEQSARVVQDQNIAPNGNRTVISPAMEEKILLGQRVINGNGVPTNRVRGGHSPEINNSNANYAVEVLKSNSDGTQVIKYSTQFPDGNLSKIKKSTVFPTNWNDADILNAIKQIGNTDPLVIRINDRSSLHRGVVNGVEIEVIKIGDDVTSAYPTGGISTPLDKF
jgi:hypothetical protein